MDVIAANESFESSNEADWSRLWVAGMAGALGKYDYGSNTNTRGNPNTRGLSGANCHSNHSPNPYAQ